MSDKTVTTAPSWTNHVQMDYLIMELAQVNFYIREAKELLKGARGIFENDIHAFVERMEGKRKHIERRIADAC